MSDKPQRPGKPLSCAEAGSVGTETASVKTRDLQEEKHIQRRIDLLLVEIDELKEAHDAGVLAASKKWAGPIDSIDGYMGRAELFDLWAQPHQTLLYLKLFLLGAVRNRMEDLRPEDKKKQLCCVTLGLLDFKEAPRAVHQALTQLSYLAINLPLKPTPAATSAAGSTKAPAIIPSSGLR